VEYPGIMTGVKNISMGLLNMNAPPEKDSEGLYSIGDEAWQKSLGKTEQEMQSHYIVPSKHKPSDAKDPDAKYYTLKKGIIDPQLLIEEARKRNLKDNETALMSSLAPFIREGFMPTDEFSQIDPIQKFKLTKGRDEKGEYVSIYDKYDFNGPLNSIVTPYEWYDRFYIDKQSQLKSSKPSKKKEGGIIKDNRGQWDHPGQITEIDSNYITMGPDPETGEPIRNKVLGVSNEGDTKLMEPGKDYKFKGDKVTEYPLIAKDGGKFMNQYTINEGDTLSKISKNTGYSVEQLAKLNNIEDPNKIYAGQKLTIPYKFNKPLSIKEIPQEHHKNIVIRPICALFFNFFQQTSRMIKSFFFNPISIGMISITVMDYNQTTNIQIINLLKCFHNLSSSNNCL
jgi:LysM repeat protein